MEGFVVQVTESVIFEDGLWIQNQLKSQNGLQRVYNCTWGSTRGSVLTHPNFSRVRLNLNLLGSAWFLGVKVNTRFDSR